MKRLQAVHVLSCSKCFLIVVTYDFEHVKRVVYLILKGEALWFTTTHPEAFHYYDEYWVSNDGVIKWHNEKNHHDDINIGVCQKMKKER